MSTDSLGLQLALDHHLRGNARVICANLPKCIVAGHAVISNKRVHNRFLKAVPHVEAASHVGRRDHDAISLLTALRGKIPFIFPLLIPAGFNVGGLERFIHNSANPEEGSSCGRPRSLDSVDCHYTAVVR